MESKKKLIDEITEEQNKSKALLAKKEEHMETLELSLQKEKNNLQELEVTLLRFERERGSLRKELDKHKELTAMYKNEVARLREEVKGKQEEIKAADLKCAERLQQNIDSLQTKLKDVSIEKKPGIRLAK